MKGQYLTRNKVYTKQEPSKDAKKIYIFCEGHRESKYFEYFKELNNRLEIFNIPPQNNQSAPSKLIERARKYPFSQKDTPEFREYNDEVWFVIDTDRWGNAIQDLRDYANENSTESNRWEVAQSNPSIEVWFYYHFGIQSPLYDEVSRFNSFKQYVDDKIIGGFDSGRYFRKLEDAIRNSEENYFENNNPPQPDLYSTQVFRLGKSIFPFVKDKL